MLDLLPALIAYAIISIPCAVLSGSVAKAKARDSFSWTILGFFLGPLALIAIAGMPDQRIARIAYLLASYQGVDESWLKLVSDFDKWQSARKSGMTE